MRNPFLTRQENTKKQSKAYWRSKKQEKATAKRLNGRLTPRSGAGKKKGDVYIGGIARIELKSTSLASFSVTRAMVDKIEQASVACDEVPAIIVEFLDPKGKPEVELAIVPVKLLEGLIHAAASAKSST